MNSHSSTNVNLSCINAIFSWNRIHSQKRPKKPHTTVVSWKKTCVFRCVGVCAVISLSYKHLQYDSLFGLLEFKAGTIINKNKTLFTYLAVVVADSSCIQLGLSFYLNNFKKICYNPTEIGNEVILFFHFHATYWIYVHVSPGNFEAFA